MDRIRYDSEGNEIGTAFTFAEDESPEADERLLNNYWVQESLLILKLKHHDFDNDKQFQKSINYLVGKAKQKNKNIIPAESKRCIKNILLDDIGIYTDTDGNQQLSVCMNTYRNIVAIYNNQAL